MYMNYNEVLLKKTEKSVMFIFFCNICVFFSSRNTRTIL